MPRESILTLRKAVTGTSPVGARSIFGPTQTAKMTDLAKPSLPGSIVSGLFEKNVLLDVTEQFAAALALIALDGTAARIVVCPPGLPLEQRDAIARKANVDTIIDDDRLSRSQAFQIPNPAIPRETEWLLLTSGTTGLPKLVSHTLRGLTGAITAGPATMATPMWATFYDIRRYGGLQIFLRAIFGKGSIVLPGSDQALSRVLEDYGAHGVTHLSGTPSHWRRVLMTPAASAISPAYVRLSGEIADQTILDALATKYPGAKIGHAYASTEAGVGFEVNDGREGFPASLVSCEDGPVAMKVVDDTLRIRSTRTAIGYVGEDLALHGTDEFVDTGDIVLRRSDRYHFAGRRGGVINIGGQKVHPEEVEAVINRHHAVRMSLVKSRRNPIVGAVVTAEIVLKEDGPGNIDAIRQEIDGACRDTLPAWKVPATIRFVQSLGLTTAGKLARHA